MATTLTISTASLKVPFGSNVTLTATVNSTLPVTGGVYFYDYGRGIASASLVNGTGTTQISTLMIGTHFITAQYFGDSNNQPSTTSGSINQVITGTTLIYIYGTTSILQHYATSDVTIQ